MGARRARITGGSSLRFCYETQAWLGKPVEERGTPHTVFCGCGVDEFIMASTPIPCWAASWGRVSHTSSILAKPCSGAWLSHGGTAARLFWSSARVPRGCRFTPSS